MRELLHAFDEVRGWVVLIGVGGDRAAGEWLRVGGEEREAETEGGRGKDGEGFGEDVGDGFGLEEVRVELVAGWFTVVSMMHYFELQSV